MDRLDVNSSNHKEGSFKAKFTGLGKLEKTPGEAGCTERGRLRFKP